MEEASKEHSEPFVFLPEILRVIFSNLKVKDLCRAAAVSKSWNEVATREQKQRGIERVLLSVKDDVYDSISVKPYVTFMFCAPKVIQLGAKGLLLDALKKYKDRFPKYLVTIALHHVIMNDQNITCKHGLKKGQIVSLLIPEYRDLKIRANYVQDLQDDDEFLEQIYPEDVHGKATFIVFSQPSYDNSPFYETLKKTMAKRQQSFNMWGACFDSAPFAAVDGHIEKRIEEEFNEPDHNCGYQYNGVFAMSITGSSLQSWTVVIDGFKKRTDFDKKLQEFRDQITLKRHQLGFATGPSDVLDFEGKDLSQIYKKFTDMFSAVKKTFPDVQFTAIYDGSCLSNFHGFQSLADDPKQKLEHNYSLSLMILTWD